MAAMSMRLVGMRRRAASGIDTKRVVCSVYVVNGLLAGLSGITLASRLGTCVPNSGLQYELEVIAAVVVGGTSLMGGVGSVAGAFCD